jgi:hypothetical protein
MLAAFAGARKGSKSGVGQVDNLNRTFGSAATGPPHMGLGQEGVLCAFLANYETIHPDIPAATVRRF